MTAQNNLPPLAAAVRGFMKLESASGVLMLAAAMIAMLAANSPLAGLYNELLDTTVAVQVGALLTQSLQNNTCRSAVHGAIRGETQLLQYEPEPHQQ